LISFFAGWCSRTDVEDYIQQQSRVALFDDGAALYKTMERRKMRAPHSNDLTLNAFTDGFELFHTPTREAYATVPVNGHRETWPLKSAEFRHVLADRYYTQTGTMPGVTSCTNLIRRLEGEALFQGSTHRVHLRVAEYNGCIYVDLANDRWEAVEITPDGWHLTSEPPVKFRRVPAMAPLPRPKRGGSIDLLRPFVNVASDTDWMLLVAFLVNTFRPRSPYPVLVIQGQYGTAKSTLTRVIRALTDPNEAPIRPLPRSEQDLFISASHSWVLTFDNLSQLSRKDADALCRLTSGGGFATRQLRTNDAESLLTAARSVVVNSMTEVVTYADLRDRAMVLRLPEFARADRRDERQLWCEFNAVTPRIFGSLLDAVSLAWRDHDRLIAVELPRMADVAKWACAAAPACGWSREAFLRAYASCR
jgi:hypothetical protein